MVYTAHAHIVDCAYTVTILVHIAIANVVRMWPHPLNCIHACVRLLFKGGYYSVYIKVNFSDHFD